jgi:hypothetical protein
MKNRWIIVGIAAVSLLLGAAGTAAHSYNPIKWIKKGPSPTASEQLAANKEEEKKLSLQLQAVLPPRTTLKDACAGFKDLNECVAALHVSHNLSIKFNCLKWDMTGAKPGWRRQILRGPLERQGDGPEQSDPRVEAGCPFPDRSEERRETGPGRHQGRVLVKK